MTPNKIEAQRHLSLLDNKATTFTFQTFDDDSDRRDPFLTKILHGSLDEHWDQLCALNLAGAGIFVTVNETDGKGRKSENIIRPRALWVDDDGDGIKPDFSHFTVVTSPGKYHHYVLVNDLTLEDFVSLQQYMVETFNSDSNAKDIARVLRLAGFYHQKVNRSKDVVKVPFMVRLVESNENPPLDKSAISVREVVQSNIIQPCERLTEELVEELRNAIKYLDLGERGLWIETGSALKSLGDAAFSIWHDRSAECQNYEGIDDCLKTWNSLSSDRTNYKAIFAKAQRNGWANPKSRLARGPEVFNKNLLSHISPRKTIHISELELSSRVSLAANALSEIIPPTVYQRGLSLVEVSRSGSEYERQGNSCVTSIRALKPPGLRVKLSSAANWVTGKFSKPTNPCDKTVTGLLECPDLWQEIPRLNGICEIPILKANGQLISKEGYDPESGLYLTGAVPEIDLPDSPSVEDALNASERLLEVFSEFSFVEPDLDRSVLLAYLMTIAKRHELPTAPMFGIDASTPGSGKTLLANCANLIVRGRKPEVMPPVKGSGAEEETRKRITALLIQGDSSVLIDNWTTPVGGESLNVMLTAESWTDRVLNSSETINLPSRVTLAATGNNLVMRGDMTRRSLVIRLDPQVENPELRSFEIKDLSSYVSTHRPELLSALFTIFKAFQLAGHPQTDTPVLGSFEEWHRRVVSCLLWLGYRNPIDSQERLRNVDPEQAQLQELLGLLLTAYPNSVFKVSDLSLPFSTLQDEQGRLRTLLSELAPGPHNGINRNSLGKLLNRYVDRIAGGLVLNRLDRKGKTNVSHSYLVRKTTEDKSDGVQ